MIPHFECRDSKDAFDENVKHGIALTAVRFESNVEWTQAPDVVRLAPGDWESITEMQFADGSIWRLNQCHTPPTIVMKHTEIVT